MSNRLTFSLASFLILMFAFVAMPAMAQTLSATWTTNLDGDGAADDSGWNATLVYATAPAAGGLPTGRTFDPADGDGTITSFDFDVAETTAGQDQTLTLTDFRRVTLKNARDLAATSIARPKLKSIKAPAATNKFFEAVILFEAPAPAVTGTPAVAEIGPSDGLVQGDLTVTGGTVLSFTANSASMYTVVINPTATPVTVVIAAGFPHQAPAQSTDAMSSTIFDQVDPVRDATTNAATDGPDTIPVNNRKPPLPDNGQWGPGDFDFIFTLTDTVGGTAGSGIRSSSLSLVDNQDPHVLSFSNIGRTTIANQFAATVSTNNVNIEAGTVVTILATVSDMAGNEAVEIPVGNVTLAAKTMTTPAATFTSATPATGGSVGQGGTIALVFGTDPGTVTASVGTISGTGTTRMLTIPAGQTAGAVSIMLTWANGGTQTLAYTVTEAQPTFNVNVPPQSYVIVARAMNAPGLDGVLLPPNESSVTGSADPSITSWAGMPNLEDLLFRGGTIALTIKKAADTALFDHDADGADATTGKKADGTDGSKPRQYAARDLIMTEVMAAINEAKPGTSGETEGQWIEIYNPNKTAITGTLTTQRGRPALGAASDEVLLDRLSNVVGGGWKFTDLGENGFDDDDPTTGDLPNKEFASFYRTERGKDGHVKGHWKTSSEVYSKGYKGTPGDSERGSAPTIGADTVSLKPAIINEVANYPNADQDYEWIEIMVTDGSQRFKNWELEIITAAKTIKRVVTLPEIPDAQKISSGGILLITSTDPSGDPNHPLAAGYNVMKNDALQVNGVGSGHPVRYIVKKFDNNLPDDGNFVLTLRTRNDRDNHEGIVDIAGYDNDLKLNEANFFTNLWPLRNYPAPVSDKNKLGSGTVHRRQHAGIVGTGTTHGDKKDDQVAMRDDDNRWTGVGYKRNAAATAQNGGTPGYPNGALKSEGIAQGSQVIISEIMYDTSRNLPQWIELQNLSTSEGVNIDNWSIFVVNHNLKVDGEDYTEGKLSETIDLDGRIPPGQTFLIASSGSRSDTSLPSERIHNLRRGRGEKLLNPNGFRIALKAKTNEADANKHQLVDDVGNLPDKPATSRRADAQSFMDPVWELPSGTTEDGYRVSISRKTTKKTDDQDRRTELLDLKEIGVVEWGWIRSDMDPRLNKIETVYYGHSDDIGSPGATVGSVLPVSLSKFRPERMKDTGAVVIRWITQSETNNAGFNILRSETREGEFTKLNTKLIAGQGTTSERTAYEFADTSAKPNVVYYYQIQDVSFDGDVTTLRTTHLRGNVTAAGKLTTTWGELKALQ